MSLRHYILDKERRVRPATLMQWARWFETDARIVKKETVGDSKVSTIFLGLDSCRSVRKGSPVLWETMVFGGKLDQHWVRCAGGIEQAEAQHAQVVRAVREAVWTL